MERTAFTLQPPPSPAWATPLAAGERDRLVSLLIADALHLELTAAHPCDPTPLQEPVSSHLTTRRCCHALRVLAPMLARSGMRIGADAGDLVATARMAACFLLDRASAEERRMLRLTGVPASRCPDECLLTRLLQSQEATLAYAATELVAAAADIERGHADAAVAAVDAAAGTLSESSPLLSLMDTMPAASIRRFTGGAHTIDSHETSVRLGQDAVERALRDGGLSPEQSGAVGAAMDRFSSALLKWRPAHRVNRSTTQARIAAPA